MQSVTLKIQNPLGLHARSSAKLVRLATTFESQIELLCANRKANAKSILEIMLLSASYGSDLTLKTEGPDEREALEALSALVSQGFGEL